MASMWGKGLVILIVSAIIAYYINYPAPTDSEVSQDLIAWKAKYAKSFIFDNNRIFYKDAQGRKPQGPILLCLHGFPTSSFDWIKVWPALLEKFSRVIAPDFIGFGFSDKPIDHEYSIMEQADLVEYLLNIRSVKDVHILAHDYGDTVAQELLARYEDREASGKNSGLVIHSVSLLNGGIFPETNFPQPMQKVLLIPYLNSVLARLTNYHAFKRAFGDVFGPTTQPSEEEFRDFWALVRKNDGHLVSHKLLQYIPERSANKDRWTGVLQKTSVPVQTIYGPSDPVNPPGFVAFYKETVPNPRVSVLDGHIGHYPQWEDPSGCMEEYFNFVRTLPYKPSPAKSATEDDKDIVYDDPIISPPSHLKRKVEKLRQEKEAAKKKLAEGEREKVEVPKGSGLPAAKEKVAEIPKVLPKVVETPKVQPKVAETPKVQPKVAEMPKVQPKVAETPKVQPKVAETPKVQPKVAETPKVQPKVAETPKIQPKVVETPKVQPKVAETPKVQPKVAETPKVQPKVAETPKVQPKVAETPKVHPKVAESPKVAKEPEQKVTPTTDAKGKKKEDHQPKPVADSEPKTKPVVSATPKVVKENAPKDNVPKTAEGKSKVDEKSKVEPKANRIPQKVPQTQDKIHKKENTPKVTKT